MSGSRCCVISFASASMMVLNSAVLAWTPLLPVGANSERQSASSRSSAASVRAVSRRVSNSSIRGLERFEEYLVPQQCRNLHQQRRPRRIGEDPVIVDHDTMADRMSRRWTRNAELAVIAIAGEARYACSALITVASAVSEALTLSRFIAVWKAR